MHTISESTKQRKRKEKFKENTDSKENWKKRVKINMNVHISKKQYLTIYFLSLLSTNH